MTVWILIHSREFNIILNHNFNLQERSVTLGNCIWLAMKESDTSIISELIMSVFTTNHKIYDINLSQNVEPVTYQTFLKLKTQKENKEKHYFTVYIFNQCLSK